MNQPWPGRRWISPDRREAVSEALERLEATALHPETIPIHDALYHLRSAMDGGDVSAAHAQLKALGALVDGGLHPDRHRLAELIKRFRGTAVEAGVPRRPTAEQTLEELGVAVIDGDVPGAIKRFVDREAELRRAIEDRLGELEARHSRAVMTSNLLSVVSVVLAGLLLATGAVALDLVEIQWMEPATWDEQPTDPSGATNTERGSVR